MTTNTMCNHDSPIYFKSGAKRLAFTEQELSIKIEFPKDIKFYAAKYSYEDLCNGVLPQSLFIWQEDYKDRPIELISSSKGRVLVVLGEKFKEKLESDAYNRIYCNEQVTAYLYTHMLKQE